MALRQMHDGANVRGGGPFWGNKKSWQTSFFLGSRRATGDPEMDG